MRQVLCQNDEDENMRNYLISKYSEEESFYLESELREKLISADRQPANENLYFLRNKIVN